MRNNVVLFLRVPPELKAQLDEVANANSTGWRKATVNEVAVHLLHNALDVRRAELIAAAPPAKKTKHAPVVRGPQLALPKKGPRR
jgi:hypothetical protein